MEQVQQQQQVARTWKGEGEQSQRGGVFDSLLRGVGAEHMTIDQCEAIREMDIGAPVTVSADVAAKVDSAATVDIQVGNAAAFVPDISVVKKRRGRPPRNQGKVAPRTSTKAMEEEDVCFICFDGGSLVLCDRRGCPKAYHPACIKREEAFFQSNAKWNCGWHICSSCEKASHFMCYTCPYSLCKGCAKFADYLCVRGNKGFCRSCMKMIMLIENLPAENSEQVQVDFDDSTSWEYLFKVYWVCLKESLLLTVEEILKAKNSGQVNEVPKTRSPWKVSAVMDPVSESSSELCYGRDDKATSSSNSYGSLDTNYSKRRKYDVEPKVLSDETSVGTEKSSVSKVAPMPEGTKWATKELLELVTHVRNGDASFLSQSEVQVLLLEYIRRNNLRDPHRKCQILCDTRLINLFGKTCVGHIEMVKLLQYHLLMKENPSHDESVRVDIAVAGAGTAAAECSCTEVPFAHSYPNMGPHCKSEGNIKEAKDHLKLNHEGMGSSNRGQNISAVSSVMHFPPPTTEGVISNNDDELQRLWHYRDPFGTVQGPFPMVQLRNWSISGLFPLDLRVWMMNGEEAESVLLTDALLGSFHKEIITDRSDKDSKWNCASSQDTAATHIDENTVHQNGQPEKKDSSSTDVGNGELTSNKELGSHSSRLTMLLDLVIGSNELDQNSEQLCDLSRNSNSDGSQSQICDSVASPSTSVKVCDVKMLDVTPVNGEENKSTGVCDVMGSPHKTNPKEQIVVEDSDGNEVKNEGCSSQSSVQSWHPTHMNISYGWDLNSTFPSMVNSHGAVKNEQEVSFSEVGSSLPKQDNVDTKDRSGEQKYSVSCNVSTIDAKGPSTTSRLVGGARLPDVAAEWTGYSSVHTKPSVGDWGSNLVSASSLRLPNGSSGHASIPTSGAGDLRHTSLSHASIDTTGWQAMVSEPNEFSLVDESVSDLLAEVEAMESLGGFPSPTSKLSCVGDVMHVSDNDCFSPIENFSPAPPHGRSAALSSAGNIQMSSRLSVAEEQLGLSIMSSQPIVPRDSLEKTKKPPQLTVTEPFHISLMLPQPLVTSEPQSATGPTPSLLLQSEGPIGNIRPNVREALKNSSGHRSNEVERGSGLHNVTANWWGGTSEAQAHQSSSRQAKLDLDIQLPSASNVSRQVEARSDVQFPSPAIPNSIHLTKTELSFSLYIISTENRSMASSTSAETNLATAKTILSTAASVAATVMLARTVAQDFIPDEIHDYFFSSIRKILTRFSSQLTMVVEEYNGIESNQIYDSAEIYLASKVNSSTLQRLNVSKVDKENQIQVRMEAQEEVTDVFHGVKFKWVLVSRQTESSSSGYSRRRYDHPQMFLSKERSFEVSFPKQHKSMALESYFPHIVREAKSMNQENKTLKLSTVHPENLYGDMSEVWSGINLDHPATFDTLAMDTEVKNMVLNDLDRFLKRKDYYRKVGKAWKRGYLLYGPPGTGKSSLIAAMANYLHFDIYDLELTQLSRDSELRRLLIATPNRSILVVEDIDCTIDLKDRSGGDNASSTPLDQNSYNNGEQNQERVSLSGLLNFIDGLWSSCGDQRIIVFTTNHKEKLDPALLRPGRMDVHINLSYCTPCGFRILASNYLGLKEHTLFPEIEQLISGSKVSPAEVAEQLMRYDESDHEYVLTMLIEFLKLKQSEDATNGSVDSGEDQRKIVEEINL